jgi:ELWxxDGT repeat protein
MHEPAVGRTSVRLPLAAFGLSITVASLAALPAGAATASPVFTSSPIAPVSVAAVDGGLLALVPASFEAKTELWELGIGGTRLLSPRLDETHDRLSMVAGPERAFVLGGRDADFIWAADAAGLVPIAEEEIASPLGVRGDRLFLLRHYRDNVQADRYHVELSVLDGDSGDSVIVGPVVDYTVDASITPATTTFAASRLVTHRGLDYFAVVGDSGGRGLWVTNGSPGTSLRVAPWPASCAVCGEVALASSGALLLLSSGNELWRMDVSDAGVFLGATRLLAANAIRSITPAGGRKVFFVADTSTHGSEVWITDGTPAGTRLVRDLYNGAGGSNPRALVAFGRGGAAFIAQGPAGRQLWKTNGTKAGTQRLTPAQPGNIDSVTLDELISVDGKLLFQGVGSPSVNDREVWISDGTRVGTRELLDLNDQAGGSAPTLFTATPGRIYFRARLGTGISLVSIDRVGLGN